ncbi:Protein TRIGALACTOSYLDIACYLGLYCEROL 3 [Pleodorina starrii]|nr:Protein TRIGALACTOSYLDIACYLGLYCEROL 3 [Pleodorina starrii]
MRCFPVPSTSAPSSANLPLRRNVALGVSRCAGRTQRLQRQSVGLKAALTEGQSIAAAQQEQLQAPVEDDVLIEFNDVYKSFGDKPILRGATFKIRRGEAVGIIGASGTGKSTTLRLAAGLLQPDRGVVKIQGVERKGLLSDQADEGHLRVGMVFQNAALFDSLTVGENVGFLLYEHSTLPDAKIKELVADSLAKVGLRGVESLYPAELSGGMKKRVALARAVVSDLRSDTEQVIMYDEPTAGLDPVASTVVEDLMRSLHVTDADADGKTSGISSYIVVTHQHSTIRRAVDRIIFLHQGRVVWEGSVAEFDTTDEPIVRQFAEGSLEGPISYV